MAKAPDVQKDEFENKEKCPWSIAIHQRWNSPEIILRTYYDRSLTFGDYCHENLSLLSCD